MRLLAILVYYLGGIAVCIAVSLGVGLNGQPRWYVLISPAILAICIANIDDPWMSIRPPRRAALIIGGLALLGSIAGYFYGSIWSFDAHD